MRFHSDFDLIQGAFKEYNTHVEQETTALSDANSKLTEELTALCVTHKRLLESSIRVGQEKTVLSDANSSLKEELTALSVAHEESREYNAWLQDMQKSTNDNAQSLRSELEKSRQECERQDAQLKEMVEKNNTLEDVNFTLKQTSDAKSEEIDCRDKKNVALEGDLQKAQRALGAKEKELKETTERKVELEAFVNDFNPLLAKHHGVLVAQTGRPSPALPAARTVALPSTRAANAAPVCR